MVKMQGLESVCVCVCVYESEDERRTVQDLLRRLLLQGRVHIQLAASIQAVEEILSELSASLVIAAVHS